MKIVITGGSGFIGMNLVERCLSERLPVINLDVVAPRNSEHNAVWQQMDIRNLAGLKSAIDAFQPTHIAHLAARTDLKETRSLDGYSANVEGVRNMIEACASLPNLERIIFASSMLVCQNGYKPRHDTDYCPTTLYGESKVAGEQLVRSSTALGARWVLIRPTSIWGPWFGPPYRDFFLAVARERYWHPGNSSIPKALGYVGNTVHQILKLLQAPASEVSGRTFYLADDPPYTIREWATLVQQTLEVKPIRQAPLRLLKLGARIGDFAKGLGWESVPLTSFRLRNMLTESAFDLKELIAITGRQPFTLAEGVSQTIGWLDGVGELRATAARGCAIAPYTQGLKTKP